MRGTMLVSIATAAAAALTVGVLAATAGNGTTMATGGSHAGHAMRTTAAATLTASDLRSTLGGCSASTPRSR